MVKRSQKWKIISSSSDDEESSFPPPSQARASTSIVDSVLRTMFSKPSSTTGSKASYLPASSQSTSVKASFRQAHAESNKGLKGKARTSNYNHPLKKEEISEKSSRGRPKTLDFHIARIVFLPCGVEMPNSSHNESDSSTDLSFETFFPVLRQSQNLTSAQLSRLEAAGLARSNFREYFKMSRDWTWRQVDELLRDEFPRLFEVLDTQSKIINPAHNTEGMVGRQYKYLPPYLLCLRNQRDIVVAGGIDFPDGETLFQKLKAGKRPSRDESEMILVTRDEVPLKLIAQWVKKQQSKGKGKQKKVESEHDSSPEDIESIWTKTDSGNDTDDPISSPVLPRLKRRRIDPSPSPVLETEQPGPSHSTPGIIDVTTAQVETIDLTDEPSVAQETSINNATSSSALPDLLPSTLPSTPPQAITHHLASSSFTIDPSLSNPWKGNRTFQF